jgi:predicted glycosyltransferase
MQAEQMVNSQRASALGAASMVAPELNSTNMTEALHAFLNDQRLPTVAQKFALQHKDFDSATQAAQMTAILEQLI